MIPSALLRPVASESRISRKSGVTLIELLVVIAIVSLLAAITTAGVGVAVKKGHQNAAAADCNAIAGAIDLFYEDNGYMPVSRNNQGMEVVEERPPQNERAYTEDHAAEIIRVLVGDEAGTPDTWLNPTRKKYLETKRPIVDGVMRDPWGTQYIIILDGDFDEIVDLGIKTFRQRALVVSPGPDKDLDTLDDNQANIYLGDPN